MLDSDIDAEVEALNGIEEQASYLRDIFAKDQGVRLVHTYLPGKEKPNSLEEYMNPEIGSTLEKQKENAAKMQRQDELNLKRIEKYLAKFGHPKKDEVGELAALTPWVVIHHCPYYEVRERYFKTMYMAYLDNDINGGKMTFFLERMLRMKSNDKVTMNGPYSDDEKIDLLIEKLGLVEEQAEVRSKREG